MDTLATLYVAPPTNLAYLYYSNFLFNVISIAETWDSLEQANEKQKHSTNKRSLQPCLAMFEIPIVGMKILITFHLAQCRFF